MYQHRCINALLVTLLVLAVLANPVNSVHADSGPPWLEPTLDDLALTVMDPWAPLDSDVVLISNENDFSNGYIDVEVLNGTEFDELRLSEAGSLTINGNAVYWDGDRIGTIDNEYDGENGHFRINFSSSAPLINADFETGDFSGWEVDTSLNQMMGQVWSEGPLYDGSPPSVSTDSDLAMDDQISGGYTTATIEQAAAYSGNYGLKLNISGTVTSGFGTGHSPSVTSSLFSANAGDTIVMHWMAARTSDFYDVFGFVFEDKNLNGTWDTDESMQRLFHETGSQTNGWEDLTTQLTIGGNLRFWFINGTYDQTGGRAIGSYLYVDGIELQIAEVKTVDSTIAEFIVEHMEYRNTACSPITTKDYAVTLKTKDGSEGFSSAQILIDVPAMPIMEISGNGITIPNEDSSPELADGTYFGLVNVDTETSQRTFTIRNSGVTSLTLNNSPQISISGTHSDDFSIIEDADVIVPVGASTTFTVLFDPSEGGTSDAVVSIENNDRCKCPYTFAVQGDSMGAPTVETGIATGVTQTQATLNAKVNAGNSDTVVTFEIGLTEDYGTSIDADQSPLSGGDTVSVTASLSGLTPNITYHYRVVARNDLGYFMGDDRTFLTVDYPYIIFDAQTYPEQNSIIVKEDITQIIIEYSRDVWGDSSHRAANSLDNYYLFESLEDGFQNITCADITANGLNDSDLSIPINSITYDRNNGEGPFIATLNVNGQEPLPIGEYRLFICGTTSVTDITGNKLNDGLQDSYLDFAVESTANTDTSTDNVDGLPLTGFPPNRRTILPIQQKGQSYQHLDFMTLSIPSINVDAPILGVPLGKTNWNLCWLRDNVGWLHGTAFPTWAGNSVLTAHAINAEGEPGLFAQLDQLKWGDELIVSAWGQEYVYEVRSVQDRVDPTDLSVLDHEEYPWLTLISCKGYDASSDTYAYRVVVRAIQVDVH